MAVRWMRLGMYFSGIADPGAAVFRSVCVDTLAITSRPRNPDPVVFARHRCEVADDHS
jgi:hypothetical protein